MVRKYEKERVCEWFKTLEAPERIELMCSLIQHCHPLEVRFFGTCIEDMARKDFLSLRADETNANKLDVVNKLNDINDQHVRSQLILYLSLMHTTNSKCANVFYETLNSIDLSAYADMPSKCTEGEVHEDNKKHLQDVIMAYTLAGNHPAISVGQRQVMKGRMEALDRILKKCCTGKRMNDRNSAKSPVEPIRWVNRVEVTKFDQSRRIFYLNVSWSDGSQKEIIKSHADMHQLQTELIIRYPVESSDLLLEVGPSASEMDVVTDVLRNLHKLPFHILSHKIIAQRFDSSYTENVRSPRKQNSKSDFLNVEQNSSSPSVSPASSVESNLNIAPNIYELLKTNRLTKYASKLQDFTLSELKEKSKDDFLNLGITSGASEKLFKIFQDAQQNGDLTDNEATASGFTLVPSSMRTVGTTNLSMSNMVIQRPNYTATNSTTSSPAPLTSSSPHPDSPVVMVWPRPGASNGILQPPYHSAIQPNGIPQFHTDFLPYYFPYYSSPQVRPSARHSSGRGANINKSNTCFNCGQFGHKASVCQSRTMDDMTTTSRYQLRPQPKQEEDS
ncbi:DgyrCDS5935 [Dimorphilus gyrociliatus]|uniref:DgyrCDS5935 n=1 Tax=Dimorphilus gyrociliatus TaxID=2664684 RepID=A0A7I8VN23_9ANNE|nr:DgyrCDS5935 [Dimorphilus gyrociliatus]